MESKALFCIFVMGTKQKQIIKPNKKHIYKAFISIFYYDFVFIAYRRQKGRVRLVLEETNKKGTILFIPLIPSDNLNQLS